MAATMTKGELTRRAILDAAVERFGRDGFRATAVADIARDAGVGGTVAYAYFPNKEALFLAALDRDAAEVIQEGVTSVIDARDAREGWRQETVAALVAAVTEHPLTRRVLAGLELDVIDRVLEIPALTDLRVAVADRLRAEQGTGLVRADVDPTAIANGIVSIMLAVLLAVVQVGPAVALAYAGDVTAVFEAALDPVKP